MRHLPLISLALAACATPTAPEPIAFCGGPTAQRYDPASSTTLDAWPDDFFAEPDASSPTGSRVRVTERPFYAELPGLLQGIVVGVEGASGFGTQAEIVMDFSGRLGELADVAASIEHGGVQLLDLSTEPPTRRPFEARLGPTRRQLILLPVGPLRPDTEHAVLVTNEQLDENGVCIAPSPILRSVLDGTATEAPFVDRITPTQALLARVDVAPGEVSALLTFHTHADHLPYLAAAAHAREAPQAWSGWNCVDDQGTPRCDTLYRPIDYREDGGLVGATPGARFDVPVSFWLPPGVVDPPIMVYAHGLGQERLDGRELASMVLPLGIGLVASDALFHGEHPTANGNPDPTAFLGIDLSDGIAFNLAQMRSSFDQSNLDRRQLLSLLQQDPDPDGDGAPDFDNRRVAYLGVSLGGILGSGLLAISDDIDTAVLAIAGGNLVAIVRDTEAVAQLRPLLANLAGGDDHLESIYSVLQTSIDPSDPALFASMVQRDRAFGGPVPDVLLPVAVEDEIVPFTAGRALARAYPLPPVGPVVVEVPGLPEALSTPVQENLPSGATAGYFQYDRITRFGVVSPAPHTMPRSEEFVVQLQAWMNGWLHDGYGEIVDPYAVVGTPPL